MHNEEIVHRYARAVADRDTPTAESLRHAGWTASLPQTGERTTTSEGLHTLLGEVDPDPVAAGRLLHVSGEGDAWSVERLTRAADGTERFVVALLVLEDGLVREERLYLAARFDPGGGRPQAEPDHGSMRPDDPLRDRFG